MGMGATFRINAFLRIEGSTYHNLTTHAPCSFTLFQKDERILI